MFDSASQVTAVSGRNHVHVFHYFNTHTHTILMMAQCHGGVYSVNLYL